MLNSLKNYIYQEFLITLKNTYVYDVILNQKAQKWYETICLKIHRKMPEGNTEMLTSNCLFGNLNVFFLISIDFFISPKYCMMSIYDFHNQKKIIL